MTCNELNLKVGQKLVCIKKPVNDGSSIGGWSGSFTVGMYYPIIEFGRKYQNKDDSVFVFDDFKLKTIINIKFFDLKPIIRDLKIERILS